MLYQTSVLLNRSLITLVWFERKQWKEYVENDTENSHTLKIKLLCLTFEYNCHWIQIAVKRKFLKLKVMKLCSKAFDMTKVSSVNPLGSDLALEYLEVSVSKVNHYTLLNPGLKLALTRSLTLTYNPYKGTHLCLIYY